MSWTKESIDDVKRAARVEDIVGRDANLKREGDDLVGCCVLPGHKDDTPSLRVSPSKQLWRCHGCGKGGGCVDWVMQMHGVRFPEAMRTLAESTGVFLVEGGRELTERRIVARYRYIDEAGAVLYTIERHEPGKHGRKKDFLQRLGTDGEYVKSPRQVPFNLPAVVDAARSGSTVYVCEGEKAATAVADLGLCATTHAGGASATKTWTAEFAAPLKGAHVVLLPDNDDVGTNLMKHVAGVLAGIAASVTTVVLPVTGKGDDAVDWIATGGTRAALEGLVQAVRRQSPQVLPPNALTDSGNAERWVAMHGHMFRHDVTRKAWLAWDGSRWRTDGNGAALLSTKDVARSYLRDLDSIDDTKRRIELVKHANMTEARARREAILALAQSEPGIAVLASDLDADPWSLNVENGTVDLKTGKLRAASAGDLITKRAPVFFDERATAPKWEAFLSSSLPDLDVREFLQRFIGYACTGVVREHVLPFFWGSGGNGKGTFVETIARLLGDYASPVRSDLLLEQQGEQHPTELADLKGRRFCFASEPKKGRSLNEDQVKLLTGGDTIKARYMRQDFFEFTPSHKLCVLTNHQPVVKGTDAGIWRRMRLVPWTVTPATPNATLMAELEAERPGILNWVISGCLSWAKHGLGSAGAVDAATTDLRDTSDMLGDFLAEQTITSPAARTHSSVLFSHFRAWLEARGERPWTQTAFGRAMTDRRIDKVKSHGSVVFLGIGMREGRVGGGLGGFSGSPGNPESHIGGLEKPSPPSPPSPMSLFGEEHDGFKEASDDDKDDGPDWGNW